MLPCFCGPGTSVIHLLEVARHVRRSSGSAGMETIPEADGCVIADEVKPVYTDPLTATTLLP